MPELTDLVGATDADRAHSVMTMQLEQLQEGNTRVSVHKRHLQLLLQGYRDYRLEQALSDIEEFEGPPEEVEACRAQNRRVLKQFGWET